MPEQYSLLTLLHDRAASILNEAATVPRMAACSWLLCAIRV